jgi:hypothetical protein
VVISTGLVFKQPILIGVNTSMRISGVGKAGVIDGAGLSRSYKLTGTLDSPLANVLGPCCCCIRFEETQLSTLFISPTLLDTTGSSKWHQGQR